MPDAIITATGLGCIENTEIFLDAMAREGEKLLNPTPFMQSTHNTIGSAIGLDIKCHGYNTHYSQKYASFDCGLQDAFMQLQNENIQTVLLNAHDEHSPIFDSILKHLDCWHFNEGGFKGEVAVSMMLAKRATGKTLCCLNDMAMCYKPSIDVFQQELQMLLQRNALSINDIDAVFVGVNGNEKNDSVYLAYADALFPNLPLVRYKHLFGEHFTASALGVYAAATCLQQGRIPMNMRQLDVRCETVDNPISRILFYNHSENKEHTIILLTNEKQ
jgi:3-oxoacyl-(acyl-carrier-protein) synthase